MHYRLLDIGWGPNAIPTPNNKFLNNVFLLPNCHLGIADGISESCIIEIHMCRKKLRGGSRESETESAVT